MGLVLMATVLFGVATPPSVTLPPVTPPVVTPLTVDRAATLRLGEHKLEIESSKKSDQWLAITTGWHSQFVSPFGKVCFDHPVWQTDVTMFAPSIDGIPGRFYANLWHSASFEGSMDDDSGDELDYTVGWSGPIGDDSLLIGQIKASVWLMYMDYTSIGRFGGGDELRLGAKLWQEIPLGRNHVLNPFWWTWVPLDSKEGKSEGLWNFIGVESSWQFSKNVAFNQRLCLILDDGANGLSPVVLGEYKAGLSMEVTDRFSIQPGYIRVIGPFGHPRDGRETEVIFGFGLKLKL